MKPVADRFNDSGFALKVGRIVNVDHWLPRFPVPLLCKTARVFSFSFLEKFSIPKRRDADKRVKM